MRNMMSACIALFFSITLQAQELSPKPSSKSNFADSLWSLYQTSRGENLPLFKGRQVMGGYPGVGGTAFYPFPDWVTGSIQYEGYWFHGIELLYDIYRDEVLVRHPSGIPFVVYGDRVQAFQMQDRKFVRFNGENSFFSTGFYEVMHEGKLTIYSKRVVVLDEKIIDQTIERNFIQNFKYYAYINGVYKSFNKQRQLMDLVRDKRSVVQQAVKASKLRYRKNPEALINIIAQTYNQPNSSQP